ncbi:hypothetical protein DFJ43DRAFT_1061268 [Lentinula guzmanii]|uniref:Fungal-type protein kinase domain-containing protein n=1 Tax=Lentinula guzmanii TaxID=2804957 RepID=A0AA38JF09_9AGAR|nr:hypothetical protein DFJ43DRAFT_1061268 [Lentinula guzmanii]
MTVPARQFYAKPNHPTHPNRVSTPPPLPIPVPDTPTHNRLPPTQPFSSLNGYYLESAFVDAAKELKGKFVAVKPQVFLDKYLPEHPGMPLVTYESFKKASVQRPESEMYGPLIDALKPFLKTGWSMINTSTKPDPDSGFFDGHKIKPDITVYSDRKPSNDNPCRACDMETFLELKVDVQSDGFHLDKSDPLNISFEKDGGDSRDTRGQLVTYLNAMQASQFRTHEFGVLILGNKCRLLRHTRSGIEVTTRFAYTSPKNSYLQTFFWRLSHARSALRGIDETFEAQPNVDFEIQHLLKVYGKPIWKVPVGDSSFYVSKPFTRSHHYPVGRGTRCFVAVDSRTLQKCVLKDVWRVVGYHREGEVYTRLHEHSVENIPNILAEGDVQAGESGSCGVFDSDWTIPTDSTIRQHRHYRLVLGVVGEPITEFRSTWELTKCMLDAIKAHRDASLNAKVEHRDVSPGNILIVRSQDGIATGNLIDWELSKYCEEEGNRVYERTGTVQFMAARLFSKQPTARTFGDDLESFMLVFLWLAALYAPNKMDQDSRGEMLSVYDTPNQLMRENFILAGIVTPLRVQLHSTSFSKILMKLMQEYSARYAKSADQELPPDIIKKQAMLETHGWMIDSVQEALKDEDWKAAKDGGQRQDFTSPVVEKTRKRKSAFTEYDQVFAARKKQRGENPAQVDNDSDGAGSDV